MVNQLIIIKTKRDGRIFFVRFIGEQGNKLEAILTDEYGCQTRVNWAQFVKLVGGYNLRNA